MSVAEAVRDILTAIEDLDEEDAQRAIGAVRVAIGELTIVGEEEEDEEEEPAPARKAPSSKPAKRREPSHPKGPGVSRDRIDACLAVIRSYPKGLSMNKLEKLTGLSRSATLRASRVLMQETAILKRSRGNLSLMFPVDSAERSPSSPETKE